jgi:hypothetical protein
MGILPFELVVSDGDGIALSYLVHVKPSEEVA